MEEKRLSLENRVEQLASQLAALTQRVEYLALRVESSRVRMPGVKEAYGLVTPGARIYRCRGLKCNELSVTWNSVVKIGG